MNSSGSGREEREGKGRKNENNPQTIKKKRINGHGYKVQIE
jgi:hypothetical protein